MNFNVLTLFPQTIHAALSEGVVGQSFQHGNLTVRTINPRDFTTDNHKTVDDRPFGGGDGMVLLIDPLEKALESLGDTKGKVVYLTPQGKPWSDSLARSWANESINITLICGRYAGIDQRFINEYVDEEISIGDYVLSGGEIPALVLMDSIARFCPGVLGNPASPDAESFSKGLLEGPIFTRPREHRLGQVPDFLLCGNHKHIEAVKSALAHALTALRRPDLLDPKKRNEIRKSVSDLEKIPEKELEAMGVPISEIHKLAGLL